MFPRFLFLLIVTGLTFTYPHLFAQEYIFAKEQQGCDGDWYNPSCWQINLENSPSGCTPNGDFPAFNPSGCPVNVIINDDLTLDQSVTLGGSFTSIEVRDGATLTFSDNLDITSGNTIEIITENHGQVEIKGIVNLEQSTNQNPRTVLKINGDGSGRVIVSELDLNGFSTLEVAEKGNFISYDEIRYNGNSTKIDVYGSFKANKLDLRGGNNQSFNGYGNAPIVIDDDVTVAGSSGFSFGGESNIEFGGNLRIDGNAKVTVEENAQLFICGSIIGKEVVIKDNGTVVENGCTILSMEILEVDLQYLSESNHVKIEWTIDNIQDEAEIILERSQNTHFDEMEVIFSKRFPETNNIISGTYTDTRLPFNTSMLYYRVKALPKDSEDWIESEIQRIPVSQGIMKTDTWALAPNPSVNSSANLILMDAKNYTEGEPIGVELTTSEGKKVLSIQRNSLPAINDSLKSAISGLSQSYLIVRVNWRGRSQVLKLIL